jgi:hypothetical protein
MSAHFAYARSSHCVVEKVHRTLAGNVGEVANCSALATNKCRSLGTAAALKGLLRTAVTAPASATLLKRYLALFVARVILFFLFSAYFVGDLGQ